MVDINLQTKSYVFQTEYLKTDILLNAAVENNKVNDGRWSDWEDAAHLSEAYEELIDVFETEEADRALSLLKLHEKQYGTGNANCLALAIQDLESDSGIELMEEAFS